MPGQSMAQPQNPNQASGATLLPMQYAPQATTLGATAPINPGLPGQTGPGASTAGQPFGVPTLPVTSTFQAPSISSGISTQGGDYTTLGDFQQTYGKGTGTALETTLAGLGTATNSAVQATNANVLMAANDQYANMLSSEAARGVSPDSSSHALATGDFNAKVNANLTAVDSQMELSGLDTLISSLTNEGKAHGSDLSAWDTFGDVIGSFGGVIGDVFGKGANLLSQHVGGTAGSILDALSEL